MCDCYLRFFPNISVCGGKLNKNKRLIKKIARHVVTSIYIKITDMYNKQENNRTQ